MASSALSRLCSGIRALEATREPDDAYVLGQIETPAPRSPSGARRLLPPSAPSRFSGTVIWISPDQVAAVLAQLEGQGALNYKRMLPGAEIIDIRTGGPAKSDSGIEER